MLKVWRLIFKGAIAYLEMLRSMNADIKMGRVLNAKFKKKIFATATIEILRANIARNRKAKS